MALDYTWLKLKWGYQVKQYARDSRFRSQVYIPKLMRWRSPHFRSVDILMPRSAAEALLVELQRILAEPGAESVVLEKGRQKPENPEEPV